MTAAPTMFPAEVKNALIHQKAKLLERLNGAEGNSEYLKRATEVIATLNHNRELWAALGYDYKTREIAKMIADRCFDMRNHAMHHETAKRAMLVGQMANQCLVRS